MTVDGISFTLACKRRPGVRGECQVINTGAGCYRGAIVEARCTTCAEVLKTEMVR